MSDTENAALRTVTLTPHPIDAETFAPYGTCIAPSAYGAPYGPADARLDLTQGTPRIYIMRAPDHGLRFHRLTRHDRVTQCLSAAQGGTWFIVVAPPPADPSATAVPPPEAVRAFTVSGSAMIKLHAGTWHAGPYFRAAHMDFVNLELADTNKVDHHAIDLREAWGCDFLIDPDGAPGERQ